MTYVCMYVYMPGVSFTFGEDVVAQFLRRHDLDLICRAHQVRCCCCFPVASFLRADCVSVCLCVRVRWWRTATSSSPVASW